MPDAAKPVIPALTDDGIRFITDYHLATLSTMATWGGIHSVAVGFTLLDGIVRIISSGDTQKVRNIERDLRATVSQVDGPQWISFAGPATIERDAAAVAHAVALYTQRYREPRPNPKRVVIRFEVEHVLSSAGLVAR
jgi:PPOX class probable F420-dependent enzyme